MRELPKGWAEVKIGTLFLLNNGRAFKASEWADSGLPIVRIQNLNNSKASFNFFNGEVEESYYLKGGELLFAWSGTPGTSFGAHIWQERKAVLNQHIFRLEFDESLLDKRFLRYAINQKLDELIDVAQGAVGLRHITKSNFENTCINIAPLNEQRRIANQLDKLLDKVKINQQRIDRIIKSISQFRQAIITSAISGKLTEEWRNIDDEEIAKLKVEKGYPHFVSGPTSWRKTVFSELCDLIGGSQPPKSSFVSEESEKVVRLIQIRDYKSDKFKVFIPKELAKRFCDKNDIMIGRYGPPIFQILRGLDGAYNVALIKAEPKTSDIERDYLFYWLKGEDLLRFIESDSDRTAGQDGFRKELLYSYPFFLPPQNEQKEITSRVNALFEYANNIENRCQTIRKQLNKLPSSMLAKAFRGELVSQEIDDEPATRLIERIKALKIETPPIVKLKKKSGYQRKNKKMNKKPVETYLELVEVLGRIGQEMTPNQLLIELSLEEDIDKFFELLRDGRDNNVLDISVGESGVIRKK